MNSKKKTSERCRKNPVLTPLLFLGGFLLFSACMTTEKVPETRRVAVPQYENVTIVESRQAGQPVFQDENNRRVAEPVSLAVMNFNTSSGRVSTSFTNSVFERISNDRQALEKIQPYNLETLKVLGIDTGVAQNLTVQRRLAQNMIHYSVGGTVKSQNPTEVDLLLYRNTDGKILQSVTFKDSHDRKALDDIRDFLVSEKIPSYRDERIRSGTTYRTETTHKDVAVVDWGSTLVLAGIIYLIILLADSDKDSDSN